MMENYSILRFIDDQRSKIEYERRRIGNLKKNIYQLFVKDETDEDDYDDEDDNNNDVIEIDSDVEQKNDFIQDAKDRKKASVLKLDPLPIKYKINFDEDEDTTKKSTNEKCEDLLSLVKEPLIPSIHDEFVIPRSRLLASEDSRIKAENYRRELMQQIEEKKRMKEEELKRMRLQELELERKISEQRKKMMEEYYEERNRLKKKTDEMVQKQELNKLITEKQDEILLLPKYSRSPSYLHVRSPKLKVKNASKTQRALFESNSESESLKLPDIKNKPSNVHDETKKEKKISSNGIVKHKDEKNVESSDNRILGNLAEVLQQCQQDQIKYSMELEKKKKSQKEKTK